MNPDDECRTCHPPRTTAPKVVTLSLEDLFQALEESAQAGIEIGQHGSPGEYDAPGIAGKALMRVLRARLSV